jgi:hypothetical protein
MHASAGREASVWWPIPVSDRDVPKLEQLSGWLAQQQPPIGDGSHQTSPPQFPLEHAPSGRLVKPRHRILALPRAEQVTLSKQFGAEAPLDADASHEQPSEYEQTDPVLSDVESLARPPSAPNARLMGDAFLHGALSAVPGEYLGEVGVLTQHMTGHGIARLGAT